jgi:hypothetical protein
VEKATLEIINNVPYAVLPDGRKVKYADILAYNNPGMQYDDVTLDVIAATPANAEAASTPAPEPAPDVFGDTTARMARPYLETAGDLAASAGRRPTYFEQPFMQGLERTGQYIGDMGLAGLNAVMGGMYGGAGLLGEAFGGDAQDERRLARDLAAMIDTAGPAPEGRMLGLLSDAAMASKTPTSKAEFLAGESGSVPVPRSLQLPPASNAQKTQIAGTFPTYRKALGLLDAELPEGRTLDFGAGLGMSRDLGFDTYEPFPRAGFDPTYRSASDIPDASYDRLTNLNVLNVVPREIRDQIVSDIGRVLKPGGVGIVTTRGRDVMSAKGALGPEPMSVITSADTYQKGFSQRELQEYLQSVLGDAYGVSPVRLGPAGAMIRRNY